MPAPARLPESHPVPALASLLPSPPAAAIAALEARVAWLEGVVGQLTGALPRTQANPPKRLSLASTQPLSRLVPISLAHPENAAAAKPAAIDGLGMTAAFASLDAKVEEASAAESMIAPVRLSAAPVLDIDTALIDAAAPPASSSKLNVQTSIEAQYPSITLKVCSSWRTPELRDYLHRLLGDDHGKRGGLDPDARSELQLLMAMLDIEPPIERRAAPAAWRH